MRKCRLQRLVLAAAVVGAVSVLSLPWYADHGPHAERDTAISHVDWANADETYPIPAGSPTPSPSYDGDGTEDPGDGGDGEGDSGGDGGDGQDGGGGPSGEGASPSTGPVADGDDSGGLLGLAFPVQAGMSVGLLALAFLALLPGRKMPAGLR